MALSEVAEYGALMSPRSLVLLTRAMLQVVRKQDGRASGVIGHTLISLMPRFLHCLFRQQIAGLLAYPFVFLSVHRF